jgi:hypothetical protein
MIFKLNWHTDLIILCNPLVKCGKILSNYGKKPQLHS